MNQLTNPNRKIMQKVAWFFIILIVNQIAFPAAALALTSGPSQPEVKSFEPAGTTEMVNLFSGDFTYNVPLLEVPGPDGGYPINLFYNSVTSMEQEASWTGLGWNINVGSLSRGMRGLPDDFDGEKISRKLDMRKSETTTVGGIVSGEIAGFDAARLGLSLGINYVYNSYKGAGFSIDPNLSLGISSGNSMYSYGANLSLGFSASTIDAGSANVGFSLGGSYGNRSTSSGFNISFDAKGNHDYSLNLGGVIPNMSALLLRGQVTTATGTVSFAKRTYTPAVTIPWSGKNFLWDLNFNPGGTVVYAKLGLNGSYSEQYIKNGGSWQEQSAFGYNYLQNSNRESLLDFNREKDGSVHRYKRYLATPIMTHDVYNISGQGIGGAFRAHRSDYGFLHDPYLKSSIVGGQLGGEGGAFVEFGMSGAVNFKDEVNNNWPYIDWISYKGEELDKSFESFYYKIAGDIAAEEATTYDYLGKGEARDKPLRLKREGFDYYRWNGGELEAEADNTGNAWLNNGSYNSKVIWNQDKNHRTNRKPRNTSVQPLTNKLLRNDSSDELLPEFNIKYYDASTNAIQLNNYGTAPTVDVDRPDDNQNAAFTVLGQDGVRWNYGLPVYNHEQKDAKFSVAPLGGGTCSKRVDVVMDGDRNTINYKPSNSDLRSNDMIDEQKLPKYVHTHLLTSVLGADYGDIDGIAGPSNGDVGYWMKTNYVKLSNDYQWRAPFVGANYAEGYENSPKDDIGAFIWGKREVFLPATVETKTHIAHFEVSKRYDARGAKHYIQNASDLSSNAHGEYSYKLDKIKLYSKADIQANGGITNATPLKIVYLTYDYSLCNHVENYAVGNAAGDNANLWGTSPALGGKLTLKSVHFTYEKSKRGALSPYVFDYNTANPDYDPTQIDRWGIYRKSFLQPGYDLCDNMKLPYTDQHPDGKAQLDRDIAGWHLQKINMPSGAVLNVEVERDDYAYVQDVRATRMFQVYSTSEGKSVTTNIELGGDLQPESRVIQFKLERPTGSIDELKNYIADLPIVSRDGVNYKQLAYRIRVDLRNSLNPTWEYVPGYCEIDKRSDGSDLIYFEPTSFNATTNEYSRANIIVKNSRIRAHGKTHHPMAMTSWKFLKDNLPDQMLAADLGGPPDAVTSLDQIGENINAIFTGFYKYCANNNFAQIIDPSRSYIRLNSPDRIQYGDGIRVKEIRLDDNWATTASETSTLGVAYDYTTTDEESGAVYSSGVLENEIMIGYDECALRWAVMQEEHKDGVVRDIHKYEYPMNEGYHPGASVGYSKVTVRSLASNYALLEAKGENIPSDLAGKDYGTTGQTVYEYYTAKDFPIVTSRTSLDDTETNPWATMLLDAMAGIRIDHYTGTQGYSIELNNMHGKTRQITTYAQLVDGQMATKPLTQVEYKYKTKKITDFRRGRANQEITVLDNEAEVLIADSPTASEAITETQLLGLDYEFFIDGRESLQTVGSGGVDFNVDYVPPWFILPFPWPTYSYGENRARTSVSNKIIVRAGILEEVHAFDGQAHIVTKNKVFDAQTGSPILATVENQLGGEIYNYSIPAYMAHSSMGAATENWGYNTVFYFDGTPDKCTGYYSSLTPVNSLMVPGDEFIAEIAEKPVIPQGPYQDIGKSRVIYMGELFNSSGVRVPQFDILDATGLAGKTQLRALAKNTRSGNRNLVGATIAQYSTVDTDPSNPVANPLTNRTTGVCTPSLIDISINNGRANIAPTTKTVASLSQVFLNNVLSASAADFSDDWTMEYYDYRTNVEDINPYISGLKGVWKAKSSYAYVDERKQKILVSSPKEVDIRTSGIVDEVALFNWQNPFIEYCETTKWVRTQDITKYRLGGQSVESRDVLGNYQAALYGYNDNLVTAQGVNTTYYEFGYEGFEEFNGDIYIGVAGSAGFINNGNIDIIPKDPNNNQTTKEQHENYRLTYPMSKPNGSNISYVLVRKPYAVVPALPPNLKASLVLKDGDKQHKIEAVVKAKYPLDITGGRRYKVAGLTNLIEEETEGEYTVYELDFSTACNLRVLRTDWWGGDITLKYNTPLSTHPNNFFDKIKTSRSHTGNYSLKIVDSGRFNSFYTQNLLRLKHDKEYVFSAWISVESGTTSQDVLNLSTYKDGVRGVHIQGVFIEPSGPIIEGWQKIEGTFKHNANNTNWGIDIVVRHPKTIKTNMYIDDIRIFPADGNMVSYVYDPINYKLKATLDDNNYATFYIYDESGSLISTKRETERGIISIQESRSYVEPTK